jgi:hypothetical protein
MTQISTEQQERMEAALGLATRKFEAFVEGLPADERVALAIALRQASGGASDGDDTAGNLTPIAAFVLGTAAGWGVGKALDAIYTPSDALSKILVGQKLG